jgi:hypothetical protein
MVVTAIKPVYVNSLQRIVQNLPLWLPENSLRMAKSIYAIMSATRDNNGNERPLSDIDSSVGESTTSTRQPPAESRPKAGLARTFTAFRHRNYRLFYFGQGVSLIGTWMQSIAQGWLVLQLTGSPFLLGIVGALQTLPILLFSLFGGVVADRFPKRRLLLFTQASSMILALVLGTLVATDLCRYGT